MSLSGNVTSNYELKAKLNGEGKLRGGVTKVGDMSSDVYDPQKKKKDIFKTIEELTAEDVGARPNDWTPTAEEVGARPDNWMPTAADVGAAPAPLRWKIGLNTAGWYRLGKFTKDVGSVAAMRLVIGGGYANFAPTACIVDIVVGYDYGITKVVGNSNVKQITKVRVCEANNERYVDVYYAPSTGETIGMYGHPLFASFEKQDLTLITETSEIVRAELDLTEWVNPPMNLNTEYRTTERHLGKPVYAKAIDFGALPNNTGKNAVVVSSGATHIVEKSATARYSGGEMALPYNYVGVSIGFDVMMYSGGDIYAFVETNADQSAKTAIVTVKYTKD